MLEERKNFFDVIESKLSSAVFLLPKPEKLIKILKDLEIFLQNHWPHIFSSLNDIPLSENEKKILQTFLIQIQNLNKKIGNKISFFDDFQKYMQDSLEK